MEIKILNAYPTPLYQAELTHLDNDKYIKFLDTINFQVNETRPNSTQIADQFDVLNEEIFKDLKQEIFKHFLNYVNNVFEYRDTDFILTTSWLTKGLKGDFGSYHYHSNIPFSGVYYPQVDELKDTIEFKNPHRKTFLFEVAKANDINVDKITVYLKKGLLLLFPSYLEHCQGMHYSDTPRYSIAFNFFPTGKFGMADSTVHI